MLALQNVGDDEFTRVALEYLPEFAKASDDIDAVKTLMEQIRSMESAIKSGSGPAMIKYLYKMALKACFKAVARISMARKEKRRKESWMPSMLFGF